MKQATGAVPQTYAMMRLNRWVIWMVWKIGQSTTDPRPRQVTSWWWKMVTVRHVQQFESGGKAVACPVDVLEAEETDRCVGALPPGLRRMIALAYLDRRPVDRKVADLVASGVKISRRGYFRYLDRAHQALIGLFNDVAAGVALPDPEKAARERKVERVRAIA